MSQLKTLQAIASFGLFSNDVQNVVHELGTFGVVTLNWSGLKLNNSNYTLGPIIAGSVLSENKVVRTKQITVAAVSNVVNRSLNNKHFLEKFSSLYRL